MLATAGLAREYGAAGIAKAEASPGNLPLPVGGAVPFLRPGGAAVDNSGNVFVGDTNDQRIQKFHATGKLVTQTASDKSSIKQHHK